MRVVGRDVVWQVVCDVWGGVWCSDDRGLWWWCVWLGQQNRKPLYPIPEYRSFRKRQLPTLPLLRSTIGVTELNFSVRNGKRWNLSAIVTWIRQTWCKKSKAITALKKNGTLNVYTHTYSSKTRSERAISNARLWHRCLYTCILSTSSSLTTLRNLILWLASYLDAFSTYPIPT